MRKEEKTARAGRMPRVLLVTESCAKGTGRHVMDLAEGLLRRGADVHLLYSPLRIDGSFSRRLAELSGLKAQPLLMRTPIHLTDILATFAARRYLKTHGPFDVIHGHSSKGGAIARLAGMGSGASVLYTPHGLVTMDPDLPSHKRALYRQVEWMLSYCAHRIIAVAPEERRACLEMGMSEARLAVVPNGVGPASTTPREAARTALGLESDQVVAGFVGRLIEYKAPELLIDATARIAARFPSLVVILIGDGPMKAALAERIGQKKLNHQVRLAGEMDAYLLYNAFDFFVSPSRKEGLPYVILEAMAAGLPIVATRSSGIEILVEPAVNGLVVPTDDVEALAQAMATLAAHPEIRAAQSAASLRRVAGFSRDNMVDQTLAVYRSAKTKNNVPIDASPDEEMLDEHAFS